MRIVYFDRFNFFPRNYVFFVENLTWVSKSPTRSFRYSNVSELMCSSVNSFSRVSRFVFVSFLIYLRLAAAASRLLKTFSLMFLTFLVGVESFVFRFLMLFFHQASAAHETNQK